MPDHALHGPAAWTGKEFSQSTEWCEPFQPDEIYELEQAANRVLETKMPLSEVGRGDFLLPTLSKKLQRIASELLHGRGFALLRGLPIETYDPEQVATIFWGLGTHLGNPVVQNAAGHLLGHVTDLGLDAGDVDVRLYQTCERQGYHTDSADLVALLCIRPARSGGRSMLCSASSVHNAMLERCPELLAELYRDFYTDQRGEYRQGCKPHFKAPILNYFKGELSVLYQRSYIESAQRFADVPDLSERQIAALDAFDACLDDPDLHLEMQLQAGDIQLVHNHALLHDRSAFSDWPEPEKRRHLLRLWLSPEDGRPLPPCFAQRYGSLVPGRRGGVGLAGVRPNAPFSPTDSRS